MFRIEMLPAGCGDCLWIEYGEPPDTRVVLIDGGLKAKADRLKRRIAQRRAQRSAAVPDIELLVVTHIDNDHIQGAIELLASSDPPVTIADIWFNGRSQLDELPRDGADEFLGGSRRRRDDPPPRRARGFSDDFLGVAEGDALAGLLSERKASWNRHAPFGRGAVAVSDRGTLPTVTLDGGLTLTVLGPTPTRLQRLRAVWDKAKRGDEDRSAAGGSDFLARADQWPPVWKDEEPRDRSVTNGSSILLLAAYAGMEILLGGDAYANDIAAAIDRVRNERLLAGRLPLAAFKLAHHGSAGNVSRDILERVDCRRFLISTDGSVHRHPDNLALLRVLRHSVPPAELLFNYASATTRRWGDSAADVTRQGFPDYVSRYPSDPAQGIVLDLTIDRAQHG